jgi:hypothetical protein
MKKLFLHPHWRRIIFFFPFQLLFLHLKKNLLLVAFWSLLFGFVTNSIAPHHGVAYLFLNPEYMNEVSFLSYFIVGFACGGFVMAFNISSYILNSFRFSFLATLKNPFTKYCINNYIIPGSFLLVYLWNMFLFLKSEHIYTAGDMVVYIGGFLIGFTLFVMITLLYFFSTNKDIHRLFGIRVQEPAKEAKQVHLLQKRIDSWKNPHLIKDSRDWYVETYLSGLFTVRLVRAVRHYKREMLRKVFMQNRHNAGVFSFITILSLLAMGFFREVPYLMIPAGASIFLLFTTFIILPVPLYSIFRGWAQLILIVLLLILNSFYQTKVFNNTNKAFGLNYETQPAVFSNERLKQFSCDEESFNSDASAMKQILNKWKKNNVEPEKDTSTKKPKLLIVCTSGGGLRSSLWTFFSLQYADSVLKGKLLKSAALITGSSGGMIGAAYLRECYLKSKFQKKSLCQPEYIADVSKDILNSVSFSIATSDWFLSLQKIKYDNHVYNMDRGYAFEKRLNENLESVFSNRRLCDYTKLESEAVIPMMIFSPTIVNDGRKLIISSLPVSFLNKKSACSNLHTSLLHDGIEFTRFFKEQAADSILFTSVLRMSSTFPYITPIVSLPSQPAIEIMDAGMRDNYGMDVAFKYIFSFKDWIEENTSGVVLLQLRDRHKEFPIEENPPVTIMNALTRPIGSFYGNLFYMQDFSQSQTVEYLTSSVHFSVDVVDFELQNESHENRISLSWHLTHQEKTRVMNSIRLPGNQQSIERLRTLLE